MNKTWKTILQIAGYIISAILGAAGTWGAQSLL